MSCIFFFSFFSLLLLICLFFFLYVSLILFCIFLTVLNYFFSFHLFFKLFFIYVSLSFLYFLHFIYFFIFFVSILIFSHLIFFFIFIFFFNLDLIWMVFISFLSFYRLSFCRSSLRARLKFMWFFISYQYVIHVVIINYMEFFVRFFPYLTSWSAFVLLSSWSSLHFCLFTQFFISWSVCVYFCPVCLFVPGRRQSSDLTS